MTDREKAETIGAVAIGGLILWLLWHGRSKGSAPGTAFPPFEWGGSSQPNAPPAIPPISIPPLQTVGVPPLQLPGQSGCNCSCGGGCPASLSSAPSIQEMVNQTNAALKAIASNTNSSIAAMAAFFSNPYVKIQVVQ